MKNINKVIRDFYCNGYFGRRYDLTGAIIEGEGRDWIVIRTTEGEACFAEFGDEENKEVTLNDWI